MGALRAGADAVHLDMLKTRTGTLTNVTVVGRNQTDLFVRHARGMANVKIQQIDDEAALRALGLYVEPPPQKQKAAAASGPVGAMLGSVNGDGKLAPAARSAQEALGQARAKVGLLLHSPVQTLAVCVTILGGVYLFFCYCFKRICQKAGQPPGVLIWLPLFQALPLLRAAGMSRWWFLGLLLPVLNLVVSVLWCFKIAQACGKSALTGIALLLPGLNVLALLYLAFSGGDKPDEERVATARESLVFET